MTYVRHIALAIGLTSLCLVGPLRAGEYLSAGEIAAIGGGTAAVFVVGHRVKNFDSTSSIYWRQPLPIERRLQYTLGGTYYPGKTNFVDGKNGSAITPVAATILLLAGDLAYPQGGKTKNLLQNQFLFLTGIGATKAVTGLAKGLFRRQRPYLALEPELAAQRQKIDYFFDRQSFVSGHTSSAFFSMAYLNMRVRSIMRAEMSPDEYRSWRWAPPTICFSWAGFVGWSRISNFNHYITDVMAGALTGWLLAELFASFAPAVSIDASESIGVAQSPLFLQFSFPL